MVDGFTGFLNGFNLLICKNRSIEQQFCQAGFFCFLFSFLSQFLLKSGFLFRRKLSDYSHQLTEWYIYFHLHIQIYDFCPTCSSGVTAAANEQRLASVWAFEKL